MGAKRGKWRKAWGAEEIIRSLNAIGDFGIKKSPSNLHRMGMRDL